MRTGSRFVGDVVMVLELVAMVKLNWMRMGSRFAGVVAMVAVVVVKVLSNFTILYGRRKFALYIIVGILEKILFTYFYFGDSYMFFNLSMTIGYLVPGILGRQMERQGIFKTLGALAVVTLMIRLLQIVLL